jgi:hypothetical protein
VIYLVLIKLSWQNNVGVFLQDPSSLAARILKAKYFPRDSLMEVALCKRPSFAWRSICSARDLLSEGSLENRGWKYGQNMDR